MVMDRMSMMSPPPQVQPGMGDDKLGQLQVLAGSMPEDQSPDERASSLVMQGLTLLLRAAKIDKNISPNITKAVSAITKGMSKRRVPPPKVEIMLNDGEFATPSNMPQRSGQTRSPIL
jgi:hypothetical protein